MQMTGKSAPHFGALNPIPRKSIAAYSGTPKPHFELTDEEAKLRSFLTSEPARASFERTGRDSVGNYVAKRSIKDIVSGKTKSDQIAHSFAIIQHFLQNGWLKATAKDKHGIPLVNHALTAAMHPEIPRENAILLYGLLRKAGALKDRTGEEVFHTPWGRIDHVFRALNLGRVRLVNLMLALPGTNIHRVDPNGGLLLTKVATEDVTDHANGGIVRVAKLFTTGKLLKSPALDVNAEHPHEGGTALAGSIESENRPTFNKLMNDSRTDINRASGPTRPLQIAIELEDREEDSDAHFFTELIKRPELDPMLTDYDGNNALHNTVRYGSESAVRAIATHPKMTNLNVKNHDHNTAKDEAWRDSDVEFLSSLGAKTARQLATNS